VELTFSPFSPFKEWNSGNQQTVAYRQEMRRGGRGRREDGEREREEQRIREGREEWGRRKGRERGE
jgi:hypothetical protein